MPHTLVFALYDANLQLFFGVSQPRNGNYSWDVISVFLYPRSWFSRTSWLMTGCVSVSHSQEKRWEIVFFFFYWSEYIDIRTYSCEVGINTGGLAEYQCAPSCEGGERGSCVMAAALWCLAISVWPSHTHTHTHTFQPPLWDTALRAPPSQSWAD